MLFFCCGICQGKIIPNVYAVDSFIVEEYPVDISMTINFSDLPEEIFSKRETWRKTAGKTPNQWIYQNFRERFASLNEKLAPFGCRFVYKLPHSFDIYKGEDIFAENVPILGSAKIRDWGFSPAWVDGKLLRINYLGRLDNIEIFAVTDGFDRCVDDSLKNPANVSNSICKGTLNPLIKGTTCYWKTGGHTVKKPGSPGHHYTLTQLEVKIPGSPHLVYTFTERMRAGAGPFIKLQAYGKSWVLITEGKVIINGKDLGKKKNYHTIEEFVLLKGKPLYFFSCPEDMSKKSPWPKIEKIRLCYDGRELSTWYNWAGIGRLAEGRANGFHLINENMICFYARRGKQWFYVEAGVYH